MLVEIVHMKDISIGVVLLMLATIIRDGRGKEGDGYKDQPRQLDCKGLRESWIWRAPPLP